MDERIAKYTDDFVITMPEDCTGLKEPHLCCFVGIGSCTFSFDGPFEIGMAAIEAIAGVISKS